MFQGKNFPASPYSIQYRVENYLILITENNWRVFSLSCDLIFQWLADFYELPESLKTEDFPLWIAMFISLENEEKLTVMERS